MSDNFDDMLDQAAEGIAMEQVSVFSKAISAFYNQLLLNSIDKDVALMMTNTFMVFILQGYKNGDEQ